MSFTPGISIKSNVDQFRRGLTLMERDQLPFATSLALNRTAEATMAYNKRAMVSHIDRPKPFTLNAQYRSRAERATKTKLETTIRIREFAGKGVPAGKYLRPIVFGGPRPAKGFERALQRRGLLPRGRFMVPAPGMRLNKYGNLTAPTYVRILSAVGAASDATQNRSARSRGRNARRQDYFVAKRGGKLTQGIYRRYKSGRIKPVLIEVGQPTYRKQYDWFGLAEVYAARRFPGEMRRALARALATAR